MKQRDFNAFRSPEAERFSGSQFHDAVQTLDNARRNGAFGPEPVENQVPMTPQALSHLLDRLQLAPHGTCAPRVKESPGPRRTHVIPELLEQLAEQMSPDALEVVLKEFLELDLLVVGEVLPPLQQAPSGLRQDRLVAVLLHLGRLGATHLVDRHVHVPHDVEAVEHVQGGRDLLRDHLEVRLPHVAGHKLDTCLDLRRQRLKEPLQALLCPLLGHPQEPLHGVDLVDEREVGMAASPLHLIDADGLDAREVTVGQPPFHCMFYGAKHVVPRRVEGIGCPLPREPLGPPGQEPAIAGRELLFAFGPWHPLDGHATRRALHPPPTRRRRTPQCSTAAQTRTFESEAGRSRAAFGRNPSRSAGCWLGARCPPRSRWIHRRL